MTIAGDWYNELGSHMQVTLDPYGGLTGTYVSATGQAAGRYALVGRYDRQAGEGLGTAVGWTVAWRNERHDADSVTSWNGQYHEAAGEERISTTWLLTTASALPDAWDATTVGQDVFTRRAPDPQWVQRHLELGKPASHPRMAPAQAAR